MAPASNEEQFKFLISCIRYSNNGKVDFGQVARECKIVSKGAAAKRYERMMRAHGIAPNAATIKPPPSRLPKIERKPSTATSATIKKRKADAFLEENTPVDDEEVFVNVKVEPNMNTPERFVVKEENESQAQSMGMSMGQGALSIDQAANLMQYYDSPYTAGFGGSRLSGTYACSEFGGDSYTRSMASSYALPSQQQYDFSTPYSSGGIVSGLGNSRMSGGSTGLSGGIGGSGMRADPMTAIGMSSVPSSENQGIRYQPMISYRGDDRGQGRSDSPLIVE